MDTKELPAAKARLEESLQQAVGKLINEFSRDSGLSVASVAVHMVDASNLDCRRFVLGVVEVELSI